jgi:caffeoyl-CoA O-methyltransferase
MMFHPIPPAILDRMQAMEAIDARDRRDGTPQSLRLRQVLPETGRFLALLAASAPPGEIVEFGTSGGYSTLWLSLAAGATGRHITTFDYSKEKTRLAAETFRLAGVENLVTPVLGDARQKLAACGGVAFAFLDIEKEAYLECYEMVVPCLVPGGLLAADNIISHQEDLQDFLGRAHADERLDALDVPIGKGVLLCRKI